MHLQLVSFDHGVTSGSFSGIIVRALNLRLRSCLSSNSWAKQFTLTLPLSNKENEQMQVNRFVVSVGLFCVLQKLDLMYYQ